jgi:hypothetical protein
MKLKISRQVLKLLKYRISWKSIQLELSRSMRTKERAVGETGRMNLIVAFRNFANAPNKGM